MLKKIGIGLAVLLAGLLVLISTRPDSFSIARSTQVAAPAALVFAQVNDFHAWEGWSPWAKLDPKMKATYEGPAAGAGAKYSWSSDARNVGDGNMTITDSKPGQQVVIRLEFTKPFAAVNTTTFDLSEANGSTKVTWTMAGKNNFMSKAMSLMMDMEGMVAPDFEKGLASMKTVSEAAAKKLQADAAAAAAAPPEGAPGEAAPAAPAPAN